MVYSHETMLRMYQALDANLAVEKEAIELMSRAGDINKVGGKYYLSPNPQCVNSNWQCQTSLVFFPDVDEKDKAATCTMIMKFFDIQLGPWIKSDAGWKEEVGTKFGKRWYRPFSIRPKGWEGEIRLTVVIFEDMGGDD